MKQLTKPMILLACCSLMACNRHDTGNNMKAEQLRTVPAAYCFVYCDFTNSMNTSAHAKVIRNAVSIYDSLGSTHELRFLTIGDHQYRESLRVPSFAVGGLMTELQRNRILNAKAKFRDSLKMYLEKAEQSEKSSKTCIISNIKQAIQDCLNISEKGEGNFKLVFLSDMLENCNGINIQSGNYKRADAELSKMRITDQLSQFKQLTIAVVISYSKESPNDELTLFWTKVLEKFDYKGLRVRPSPNIPWEKLR